MDVFAEIVGAVALFGIVAVMVVDFQGLVSLRGRIAWRLLSRSTQVWTAITLWLFWPFLPLVYLVLLMRDNRPSVRRARVQARIVELERELGIGDEQ